MAQHPLTPDDDLQALRRHDARAVERWFRRYADAVYTFVFYRIGRRGDLAADVVQETFLSALRGIESYDPRRGEMLGWLTLTARNCIRAARRREVRYRTGSDFWDCVDARVLDACRNLAIRPLPDELIERQETAELVRIALSQLPERYQDALLRHYCSREPLRDMASADGLSEGAVKSLLHRARVALRSAFEAHGASLDERASAERGSA